MKYGIGLDCGISSVGFCVTELDNNDEPRRIVKLGSRIFDKAEHPKDGSSLALPRREARGARRRVRRHQHRLDRIKYLLVREGIITAEELNHLFDGRLSDIYELRTNALDMSVSNIEFSRILINLAQRRGFKSNRKVDVEDKNSDAGKLTKAVNDNRSRMIENGYRTVGEMLFKDEAYSANKRNKGDNYLNTVSRDMIEEEIHKLFSAQRGFNNFFADERIEELYTDIVLSQRPFDEGPGEGNKNSPSPYAGNQIEKMIGRCTFYPDEERSAKATYSYQLFSLLQSINSITLVSDDGSKRRLCDEERLELRKLCFKTKGVKYSSIRKALGIPENERFNTLSYGDKELKTVEGKAKFEYLNPYFAVKKALGSAAESLDDDELDAIGRIFTIYKNDERIKEELLKSGIDNVIAEPLMSLAAFSGFGHISVKACRMLIPFLEKGLLYHEACDAAGIDFRAHCTASKSMLLPANSEELNDIKNPVVRRAVSQTIKVINCIIREQGVSPTYINIELARELSKSFSERNAIDKKNKENRQANDKMKAQLVEEFGIPYPQGLDIVKLKLWYEQDGICPYSLKKIELNRLFEVGYTDVDHIIPYSISFDDSYNNKVLCLSSENRQKGNRIPMQYIPEARKSDYKVWVNSNIKNYRKRQNLLKEKLTKEETEGFKERNLNDTKYLSRFLYNFIKDNLEFAPFEKDRKNHVVAVNGAITAYMRKRWGINKIREDGDLHHAVDAAVISCVTQSMIKRISKYSNFKELEYLNAQAEGSYVFSTDTGEVIDKFPYPYPEFRKELEIRTETEESRRLTQLLLGLSNYDYESANSAKPCFVSRMVNHKVTGPAHQETIRSGRHEGNFISKVPLSKLKLDKNGEIENYCEEAKRSDRLLYEALKKRLSEFDGNGETAFPVGYDFHKPKSDGTPGPVVKKVKTEEKTTLSVPARNEGKGIASNGSMVRIDVFYVEGEGYYFVPIYVADTVKPALPNKACVAFKDSSEWKDMDDNNFVFSLYPNDLIRITSKKDIKLKVNLKDSTLPKEKYCNNEFFYYRGAGISVAQISIITNDNSYIQSSLGIKSLLKIEKYQVDPIGNITKVNREKRMYFN